MNAALDSLTASDGTRLQLHRWTSSGARGTVLIVHGLGEHATRYAHVAAWLGARGFTAIAYDLRGHGTSDGKRGVIPRADSHHTDLAAVIDAVRPARGPFILLGHSMGGAIVAGFLADRTRRAVDFAILSSPAFQARVTCVQQIQLAVGLALTPTLALGNGLDATGIAHDPATVAAYRNDPLVHDRVCARLAKSVIDAGSRGLRAAPRWTVPTLLIYGGSDRLVDPKGSDAFAASAPREIVESERFDALYHEILNEGALAAPVFARIERWLDARIPA